MKIKLRCLVLTFAVLAIITPQRFSFALSSGNFVDELGREVYIPSEPKRIVSLAPNITEILFALGLGDRIVGVTNFCNYPKEALSKPKVGMLLNPDIEKILSLKPDLVVWLSEGDNKPAFEKLEKTGINLYIIAPKDISSLVKSINRLGDICRKEKEADVLVKSIEERLKNIAAKVDKLGKPRTLFLLDINTPVTASIGSFPDEMIRIAGGTNVIKTTYSKYPRIGWEEIARSSPDVIIVAKHTEETEKSFRMFKREPAVTATPASQKGRVHLIDGDIVSRMSPRTMDGVEEFARLIHPEAFR